VRHSRTLRFAIASALVSGSAVGLVPTSAQAATVAAQLVKTTNTSAWAHPSPDPSGITYNSRTGQLIISDGEVEETGAAYPKSVWQGTNLFVTSLGGAQQAINLNTTAYSNEPTGVGFRPGGTPGFPERLFVTDDDQARLFEVDAVDGIYGNGDDKPVSTSVAFLDLGPRNDAEDVAVDLDLTRDGRLLIVDGKGKRVFLFNPGPDRTFDGTGDFVERTFNVGALGAGDPEGVAYNASRGTVFVLDDPSNKLYEIDLNGGLVNTVTLPFKMKSGAGIAFAPPSGGGSGLNGYIVDRGIDNDTNQDTFNDGKLYEIAIPGPTGGVTPQPPPAPGGGTLDIRIGASTDDAEQKPNGSMALGGGDLNLTKDGKAVMTVGMRFNGVTIPANATITNAYVQFQADEVQSVATNLTIRAQVGNAATFAAATNNITSRSLTQEFVSWAPPAWNTVGERAVPQRTTPNLHAVVKAALASGWASGNSLALVITGTGERTAESFDGGAAKAPVLHIEYTVP
jgi:hypothetical protein